jgi:hypothetical protein
MNFLPAVADRDTKRHLLAQVLLLCAFGEELLGAGIGVALFYLLRHLSSNVIIPRVLICGVDPLLGRLNSAADEVDCYTNSVQVISDLPHYP